MRLALLLAAFLFTLPVGAQEDLPTYQDDRSSPEALVQSLYNAINRHEFLRAWSYHAHNASASAGDDAALADYESFKKGYEDTDFVTLLTGEASEEGAAGSIYYHLPVAIDAVGSDGKHTQFAGCYTLRLAQPAIQDAPPFQPLHIESGTLDEANSEALETILPADCTP